MGFQSIIRAVLLLVVIQLHCETPLAAKDTLQFPRSQTKNKKYLDDVWMSDVDSLERNWDSIASPYIIKPHQLHTQNNPHRHQLHSNDVFNLDNSAQQADSLSLSVPVPEGKRKKYSADLNSPRRYVESSPYIITASNRKLQTPSSKSRRRQIHSDDAVDPNGWKRYVEPSPYEITALSRQPQAPLNKSRRRQVYSGDAADPNSLRHDVSRYIMKSSDHIPLTLLNSRRRSVHLDDADLDNSGLYSDSVPSPFLIAAPNYKPNRPPSNLHKHQVRFSIDTSNRDDNLRRYIIDAPSRRPSKLKSRMMYSDDVPEEYSDDVSHEYSNNMSEDYSDVVSDQYSDATLSSTYASGSAQPARRSSTLQKFANVDVDISAAPRIFLGDDGKKPKRSHHFGNDKATETEETSDPSITYYRVL